MNVCVDASLVLKWLVPEEESASALAVFRRWRVRGLGLVAPALIDFEIGSALRKKIVRGLLGEADLYPAYDVYRQLDLLLIHPVDFVAKGLAIAAALNQPTVYDVSYLLVAKEQGIDFVTADRKFFEASSPLFPFVKYYRD